MTRTEERLTDALHAAGGAIKDRDLRPLNAGGGSALARRPGWQRWLAATAAAAAVAGIATFALVTGQHNGSAYPVTNPRVVRVGGTPTGIAVDTATSTAYVTDGGSNALSMISTSKCSAARADCGRAVSVPTGGTDPTGVALDSRTHTVYVVNADSNTVAVINAATCNAASTSGCTVHPALVRLGNRVGAELLAVDLRTDTVYVADTNANKVSVINGVTCNASDTSGCGQAPVTIRVGGRPFPIAVDQFTNTVYVGVTTGVARIDGSACNSANTLACASKPFIVPVRNVVTGIAVDDAAQTVYVSGEHGTVALLNSWGCEEMIGVMLPSALPACRVVATVHVGQVPRGDAFDPANSTVYVADAGSNDVSMFSAKTCNAKDTAGCAASPRTFPVGESPRRIAVDGANDSVYVVNEAASTVSVIDSSSCDATSTSGCPSRHPAETGRG
jgi:YVTN family beta-propeller protein